MEQQEHEAYKHEASELGKLNPRLLAKNANSGLRKRFVSTWRSFFYHMRLLLKIPNLLLVRERLDFSDENAVLFPSSEK